MEKTQLVKHVQAIRSKIKEDERLSGFIRRAVLKVAHGDTTLKVAHGDIVLSLNDHFYDDFVELLSDALGLDETMKLWLINIIFFDEDTSDLDDFWNRLEEANRLEDDKNNAANMMKMFTKEDLIDFYYHVTNNKDIADEIGLDFVYSWWRSKK